MVTAAVVLSNVKIVGKNSDRIWMIKSVFINLSTWSFTMTVFTLWNKRANKLCNPFFSNGKIYIKMKMNNLGS